MVSQHRKNRTLKKPFKGGKQKHRDEWFGINDKDFQKWWHRIGKAEYGEGNIKDRQQALTIYEDWISMDKQKVVN